jgi:hypothetical protein
MGRVFLKTNNRRIKMNDEDKLLDITHKIVNALTGIENRQGFTMSEDLKDKAQTLNESMSFFASQGNHKRAVEEGELLLKYLEHGVEYIDEDSMGEW